MTLQLAKPTFAGQLCQLAVLILTGGKATAEADLANWQILWKSTKVKNACLPAQAQMHHSLPPLQAHILTERVDQDFDDLLKSFP